MESNKSAESKPIPHASGSDLVLRARQIAAIEAALRKIGPYGEVHLIVERGRIRFVRTIKSEPIDSAVDLPDKPELPGD